MYRITAQAGAPGVPTEVAWKAESTWALRSRLNAIAEAGYDLRYVTVEAAQ